MANAKPVRSLFHSVFHNFFSFPFLLIGLIAFSGSVYANSSKEVRAAAKSKSVSKIVSSRWAKGRLLVVPRAGLTAKEFDKATKPYGMKSRRKLNGLNALIYELPDGVDEVKVLDKLKKDRRFKAVELDRLVEPAQVVTDPAFGNSWALPKIQALAAWDIATGDGITIAILDSGVDSTHPDLAANMLPGWNVYDNNTDTSDVYGHGTKVAGTAAAVANNGTGSSGVAWNARILPVRISRLDGRAYLSDMAKGIRWAADNGARVVNISYSGAESVTVQSAANYMRGKGGVVVMSAGNSGGLNNFPASNAVIVAAATDSNDARASWSSYGPYVDVAAPGVSIYTTLRGGGYGYVSGTSFSSPIVAAAAALLFSINPDLAPADIDQMLTATAQDLGSAGYDQYYGHGRINAANAVNAAYARISVDRAAPVISIASPTGGTVSGSVPVDVSYSDNKGVVRVDLYVNGRKTIEDIQPPFAFSWDTTTLADGSHTLAAYAFDAAGNQGTSSTVKVTVKNIIADTTPPTISIGSPVGGAVVSGSVPVNINSSDNIGVVRTELHINGKKVMEGTGGFVWDTKSLTDGSYTLVAYAFDAAGNQSASSAVAVSVKNIGTTANTDPLPQIVSFNLRDGQKISRNQNIRVTADRNTRKISLKINGGIIATANSNSLSYRWNTSAIVPKASSINVTVEAFNAKGDITSRMVTVRN